MSKLVLQTAMKAIIVKDSKVLILRESGAKVHDTNTNSGRYQLPGGRIEPGESFNEALDREILEETGLVVKQLYPILVGEWRPIVKGVPHQIVGIFMVCKADSDTVTLSSEHDGYKWIKPSDYDEFNILSPDWEAIERFADWKNKPAPYAL